MALQTLPLYHLITELKMEVVVMAGRKCTDRESAGQCKIKLQEAANTLATPTIA